jgi:hypothetical protein
VNRFYPFIASIMISSQTPCGEHSFSYLYSLRTCDHFARHSRARIFRLYWSSRLDQLPYRVIVGSCHPSRSAHETKKRTPVYISDDKRIFHTLSRGEYFHLSLMFSCLMVFIYCAVEGSRVVAVQPDTTQESLPAGRRLYLRIFHR